MSVSAVIERPFDRIEAAPQGVGSTSRGLTQAIDLTDWRAAVDSTGCRFPGCDRPLDAKGARGLCATDYHRLLMRGELERYPRLTREFGSADERFFSKVDVSGVCWEWTGGFNSRGYGVFTVSGGLAYAHRWAWEFLVAPIPDRMTIDHLCRNPPCVNPDHLEVVTLSENVRRANPRRTHCVRGHSLDEAYVRKNGDRMCRKCRSARRAEK